MTDTAGADEWWSYVREGPWRTGPVVHGELWLISDDGGVVTVPVACLQHIPPPDTPVAIFPRGHHCTSPTTADSAADEYAGCLVAPRLSSGRAWLGRKLRRVARALAAIAEGYAQANVKAVEASGHHQRPPMLLTMMH